MKRIITTLILCTTLLAGLFAQGLDANRTLSTKVADLLALMPAANTDDLKTRMEAVASLGEEGLIEMVRMLSETGDNTALEYTLGGFSYYAAQPGRDDLRAMAGRAYCKALNETRSPAHKAFVIRQLQATACKECVACLQPFLLDGELAGPAARALADIGTPEAGAALVKALNGTENKGDVIQALGDMAYEGAVASVEPHATEGDLMKEALYTLARIGAPSSLKIMQQAATKSGYTYDKTNATASYLLYLKNLAVHGGQKEAEKEATALLKTCTDASQVHTRTAALKLLNDWQREKSVPLLVKAALEGPAEYRAAALKFAAAYNDATSAAAWTKALKKASAESKAAILTMLGNARAESSLAAVQTSLRDKDAAVRLAAIDASGKLGGEKVLDPLLTIMKTGSEQETEAVKQAILIMPGSGVAGKVAAAVPQANGRAKVALIEILAARAADAHAEKIFDALKSTDTAEQQAAFAALRYVSVPDHLPRLISLLKDTRDPAAIGAIQQAIVAAVRQMDKNKQAPWALQQFEQLPAQRVHLFGVLAAIGGDAALATVSKAFDAGSENEKAAALAALSAWEGPGAERALYRIALSVKDTNKEHFRQALEGYIHAVGKTTYEPERKVLMLRKAMEIAEDPKLKEMILEDLAQHKTFQALLFAGRYLDDAAVRQAAATAVMQIALAEKQYYGADVRALLEKTMEVIAGRDSEYHKKSIRKHLDEMPEGKGFYPLFNGRDLDGWKGLVADPVKRAQMNARTLTKEQEKADLRMREGWKAEDGLLIFTGHGDNLCTVKKYRDFEMFVDWKITEKGDAGIYLRGSPQVQIWDTSRVESGAQVGSGGLYNNQQNPSKPLKVADNAVGEWNTFHIVMKGDRVTVHLNGELVVDNVILENYWDRSLPIFPEEQIELQAHGTYVAYRDIYIREIGSPEPFKLSDAERKEGYKVLFDGTNMHAWQGNTTDYVIENGDLVIYPARGGEGNLYTKEEYSDFIFRFEFQLTPGANNGLGIRAPLEGDAAYVGTELQILDNTADIYKNLKEYQYHGSAYGIIPAKRGFLKPVGEWNYEEVIVRGSKVKVILNGEVILDGDLAEASKNGTLDGRDHPGLARTKGYLGFLGHGSILRFRNIRIKDLGGK